MTSSERKGMLVDQILRLRRAEDLVPEVRDISAVREQLERELGRTLSRGTVAKLVGVSQTALDRWVGRGEIPSVLTPRGKKAIPVRAALDLIAQVRERDSEERHPLAAVIRDQDRSAADVERIVRRSLPLVQGGPLDGHRGAELRSLALHAVVGDRLNRDVITKAQRRLTELEDDQQIDAVYATRWRELLSAPLPQLKRALVQDTQEARDLRQNTPFTGVLTEAERRRVLSLVR